MEAGNLTDCVDFSYWLDYTYFNKDGGLFQPIKEHFNLYHDYLQLVTFLTVQSLKNSNKQLSSYDQRKQYRSGKNLICHRIFDENLGKKKIKDGVYFFSKKIKNSMPRKGEN